MGFVVAWYTFNVAFNLYNKSVLNAFPYPMFMCTMELLCGGIFMALLWWTRVVEPPKLPKGFWKKLLPVALCHLVNHVGTCFALSKSAVSFTHVIKSAEPLYTVAVCALVLKQRFHALVWLSLIPVVAGVSVAAITELNFSTAAFVTANVANLAVVTRTIVSKKLLDGIEISGINLYGCITMLSLCFLLPGAILFDGHNWGPGLAEGAAKVGTAQLTHLVLGGGITYHLYNMSSYGALTSLKPVTYAVVNTMKRVFIIFSSILFFSTPVTAASVSGTCVAIAGSYAYSRAKLLPLAPAKDDGPGPEATPKPAAA